MNLIFKLFKFLISDNARFLDLAFFVFFTLMGIFFLFTDSPYMVSMFICASISLIVSFTNATQITFKKLFSTFMKESKNLTE